LREAFLQKLLLYSGESKYSLSMASNSSILGEMVGSAKILDTPQPASSSTIFCNMPANILIVEDEKIVARDLQLALEDLGYQVAAIADSGELAIQQATDLRPDLMLMDIRLAGEMDGITAAQTIVERLEIPIVYLTAHSDEQTLARAKTTRPLGYLIKPFAEQELRAVVEIALYKHEMELRLQENAQWLSTVLHSIGDGVLTTDAEGLITFLNPVAEKLTGWSCAKAMGRPSQEVFKLILENNRKILDNPITNALKTGKAVTLPPFTLLVRRDGIEIPIEDSVAPISQHKGTVPIQNDTGKITGAVVIFRDVTQQRQNAKKLHRHAFYDNLTNLPNRLWFRERLTDAVERFKRQPDYLFAVLLLDLDRFKVINDTMGHPAEDQLLAAVADRLVRASRVMDTVTRLGGDEFAILLECLKTEQEAFKVAERILKELSLPIYIDNQEVFTNASIGIVMGSSHYEDIAELIRNADIAMYRAKAQGQGLYEVFDADMRDQIMEASRIERDLRRGLQRNQFVVYYQPVVSLATENAIGVEALVRWQHPQRGLMAAGEFMPIAEDTGLSVMIDWWVAREACQQVKNWQDQYPELSSLRLSINLSGLQIIQPVLVERISHILTMTELDPQDLTLELTETTLIEKPEQATTVLKKLDQLGIRLSLDDFGTGYSSLSYLQRFPVKSLKIDRSFVHKMETDSESLEIVRATVSLGKTLGLAVVAEGIETAPQLDLLKQMGCDYGQGYYFAQPCPPLQAIDWLRQH
jgi:diguanylate cyclase (GGDEF)-like protein/PAS domain S-box-containing protein